MIITLFAHAFCGSGVWKRIDLAFALSLHSAQRSEKFTRLSGICAFLPLFSSLFAKTGLPHKMVVTCTSYTASGFLQGIHHQRWQNKFKSSKVHAWKLPSVISEAFYCQSQSWGPLRFKRKENIPASQLGGAKNLGSIMAIKSLIYHDNKATFQKWG